MSFNVFIIRLLRRGQRINPAKLNNLLTGVDDGIDVLYFKENCFMYLYFVFVFDRFEFADIAIVIILQYYYY